MQVEDTRTRVRKGKSETTTTHAELNLFTLGLAALGLGVTAWVLGIGLAPVKTTKTVIVTQGQGWHPAFFDRSGHVWVPAHWDVAPVTRDKDVVSLTLVERPRMLLPFTSSSGSGTSSNTGLAFDILNVLSAGALGAVAH